MTARPSATPTVLDELIELRGLRFHYRDWPSRRAEAPVLVLLHGFTGHARSWDVFAEAMTDRYSVLALDQRGHGKTARAPADQYGVEIMTDDLAAFIKALDLNGFSLLRLSMGGLVTMNYASRGSNPPTCVIVDIGPEIERKGSDRIQSNVQAPDTFDSREAAFASARDDNGRPPARFHRYCIESGLMRTEDGRWTWRYDRALRTLRTLRFKQAEEMWRCCAEIAAPTLVVRGGVSDILAPAIAERMLEVIPDARLVTIPDTSHAAPYDAPNAFEAAVRTFLEG